MVFAFDDGDEALGGAAIGHLFVDLRGDDGVGAIDGEALEGEEFLDLVATGDAMLDFALTLDHKEAFLAAQG